MVAMRRAVGISPPGSGGAAYHVEGDATWAEESGEHDGGEQKDKQVSIIGHRDWLCIIDKWRGQVEGVARSEGCVHTRIKTQCKECNRQARYHHRK